MAKATKFISLLVPHVYMPEDPKRHDWRTSTETKKYDADGEDARLKYEVHGELADFLINRRQAIEVPPDEA